MKEFSLHFEMAKDKIFPLREWRDNTLEIDLFLLE